jgi:uncharacterized protein YcbX
VHVAELWRHPVKSLQGESLNEALVEETGLSGDRRWGIVDDETGMVLTARRVPWTRGAEARSASAPWRCNPPRRASAARW